MTKVYVLQAVSLSPDQMEVPPEMVRSLRRADEFILYGVLGAYKVLEKVKSQIPLEIWTEMGIYVGTVLGSLETNFRFLDSLREGGDGQGSPMLFSHSVFNALSGYISRIFGLTGPTFTFHSFGWPFIWALQEAFWHLRNKILEAALVLAVEAPSPFMDQALDNFQCLPKISSGLGVVAWFLMASNSQISSMVLDSVIIQEKPSQPFIFLCRKEETSVPRNEIYGPLGYAKSLTEAILANKYNKWRISSAFGWAQVTWI